MNTPNRHAPVVSRICDGPESRRPFPGILPCLLVAGLLAPTTRATDITSLPFVITAPGTYTMTADLHQVGSVAIAVLANDVILDLGGHTLSGSGGGASGGFSYGIWLPGVSGVTVMNGTVSDFEVETGIMMDGATGCTISGVTVANCAGGITLLNSADGNTILNNTLDHNIHANIGVRDSSANVLEGNICLGDASWAIRMEGSPNGNLLLGNTCDGAFAHGIDLAGTGNVLMGNITTNNGSVGIHDELSFGNQLLGNTSSGNAHGIMIAGDGNTLLDNLVTANAETGFFVTGTNNTVQGNTASGNGTGIYGIGSTGSTIKNNTANGNTFDGIIVWSPVSCGGNTVKNNTANGNGIGIRVFACGGNAVKGNTTNGNVTYGIAVSQSSGNEIEKNTALGNGSSDLVDDTICDNNVWTKNDFVTSSGACIQ